MKTKFKRIKTVIAAIVLLSVFSLCGCEQIYYKTKDTEFTFCASGEMNSFGSISLQLGSFGTLCRYNDGAYKIRDCDVKKFDKFLRANENFCGTMVVKGIDGDDYNENFVGQECYWYDCEGYICIVGKEKKNGGYSAFNRTILEVGKGREIEFSNCLTAIKKRSQYPQQKFLTGEIFDTPYSWEEVKFIYQKQKIDENAKTVVVGYNAVFSEDKKSEKVGVELTITYVADGKVKMEIKDERWQNA
ncbi:MAG: hypothetical protein RSB61_05055 [Clostridia bacterium]